MTDRPNVITGEKYADTKQDLLHITYTIIEQS